MYYHCLCFSDEKIEGMERLSKLAISHSSYDMSEHRVEARSDCPSICPLIMLHFPQISWKEVETTLEQI